MTAPEDRSWPSSSTITEKSKGAAENGDHPTHPKNRINSSNICCFPRCFLNVWIISQDMPPRGTRFPRGGYPRGADLLPLDSRPHRKPVCKYGMKAHTPLQHLTLQHIVCLLLLLESFSSEEKARELVAGSDRSDTRAENEHERTHVPLQTDVFLLQIWGVRHPNQRETRFFKNGDLVPYISALLSLCLA